MKSPIKPVDIFEQLKGKPVCITNQAFGSAYGLFKELNHDHGVYVIDRAVWSLSKQVVVTEETLIPVPGAISALSQEDYDAVKEDLGKYGQYIGKPVCVDGHFGILKRVLRNEYELSPCYVRTHAGTCRKETELPLLVSREPALFPVQEADLDALLAPKPQ